ncbi:MAG: MBL fold metallo-hydrolase [Devosiaceae bacterium]
MLQASPKLHHSFALGGFTVTQLRDGFVEHTQPHQFFGLNATEQDFSTFSASRNIKTDSFVFPVTVTLIEAGMHRILVDAGHGWSMQPEAGNLLASLEQAGIAPETITQVIITHLHGDHIGGLLNAAGEPAFINAHYSINSAEIAYWTGAAANSDMGRMACNILGVLGDLVRGVRPGVHLLPGLQLVASPGHTPGHMCVKLDSKTKTFFIASDLANHPVWSIAQPAWHMRLDVDREQAAKTRQRLLGQIADEGWLMAGYHMPFPAVGRIQRDGQGFAFIAEDGQP